jgi:hypothetical protein
MLEGYIGKMSALGRARTQVGMSGIRAGALDGEEKGKKVK